VFSHPATRYLSGVRHVRGWIVWWLGCFWLWLLLVGEWNGTEVFAAAVAAAAAASLAELARSWIPGSWGVPASVLRSLPSLPLVVAEDFGILMAALARSLVRRDVVRGRYVERHTTADDAWTELVATVSPNAYVVGIDPERRTILFHDLVPRPRSEEPA
jgi:hypothetical protein